MSGHYSLWKSGTKSSLMAKNIVLIENNILATNTIRSNLTKTLINEGFNVTVLTTGTEGELNEARNSGIKVINVKSGNENILEVYHYIKNLKNALRSTKADLCLTFTIRPNIWGNFVARQLKIPVISNITGIGPLFEHSSPSYKVARLLYKFALKKTRTIFFQNEDDKAIFLNKGFVKENIVKMIPGSGVDTTYFSPQSDETRNYFAFLFIGRLIRDKGILEFINSAKIVKQKYPNVHFRIVGPIWNQNLKSNIITREELDNWINEGYIIYEGASKDVRPFIANSDCIVIPSYREGMSNVLLEAGSMERPCIATNVPGCKEIISDGETGLLCKPKDSLDLANKMMKMITFSEESRRIMGKSARIRIQKYFEKTIVVNSYLKEIRKVVGANSD